MPDTKPMWQLIASIPIGTFAGWIAVFSAVIAGFCAGTVKVYKLFDSYRKTKDENDKLVRTVGEHDAVLNNVLEQLKRISEKLDSQDETTMKKLRRELVKDGERYLSEKKMTIREWKSWIEMYDEYHVKFKQNSYVESLRNKIEGSVEIVGKLDEHGNDID